MSGQKHTNLLTLLPDWVAGRPVRLRTKLLIAFLAVVAALSILGSAGLAALRAANERSDQLAIQQARINQYRTVGSLANQLLLGISRSITFVDHEPPETLRRRLTPLAMFRNELDIIQYEIAQVRRDYRLNPSASADATSRFESAVADLTSMVDLGRKVSKHLFEGDVESAYGLYREEATPLHSRIERDIFTMIEATAAAMQKSAAAGGEDFDWWRSALVIAFAGAAGLAILLGYAISSSVTRPVREIQDHLAELGRGDFAHRLDVLNRDELGELAENLNRASEMLQDLYARESAKTERLEQLSSQLAKYLSPQVYASIFEGRSEVKVAATRKKLTVFFSDIADFTEASERLEPEELTGLLNQYLTEMSRIALAHGGTIDKYVGDAIMIFFGDPDTRGTREDARACVQMAIAMRERLRELQRAWRASGMSRPLQCRMGIHTDFCTVGNFGSADRLDYTIVGRGVNIASRLETLAQPGQILISSATHGFVQDEIPCLALGEVEVKGLAHPIATYQVAEQDLSGAADRAPSDLRDLVSRDPADLTPAERRVAFSQLAELLDKLRELGADT